jgi:serine/threonine protein kinase
VSELVASTYRILGEIARTETGIVYEAHDALLDRLVALKLASRDAGTPSLITEARRCAAVRDACAVQVHGMGTHDGAEYAVAERVTGRLLRDELERALPAELLLARWRKLIAAVARAHEAGISIGDVSGSTVLVMPQDRLVLGRLSLSQIPALGPHGQILAPEIIRGEVLATDPAAAERIDLYALGCVAIEMARGAPPFSSDDRETELRGHATEPPPRIVDLRPDLPSELSDLVDWLLIKRPSARPPSARDVLMQVDAVVERTGPAARAIRVLIIDDDTARARWLWGLARRASATAIVETASEGTDAAHKLNRDRPDIVFVASGLRGVMNALELCMYARGLEDTHRSLGQMFLLGDVSERDQALFDEVSVETISDDAFLPSAIIDRVRAAAVARPRTRQPRSTVSG